MSGVTFGDQLTRSVTMDTDLSNKEGYAVSMDTTDDNNVNLLEAATAVPFVLNDCGDGSASKVTGSIVFAGRAKVKLGGVVAPGDKLTATTGGKWIATTTDKNNYGAIAMAIGTTDDIIEAIVVQGMVSAT